MKSFITESFLLKNSFAEKLYHDYARALPIVDYHNHLPPDEIAADRKFENLSRIWLRGDHYKWRAMRAFGITETFITGDASDQEKFQKWAETVPYTLRNPLYHWTHLELQRYFNITELLRAETANRIYTYANEALSTPEFSTQKLLTKMNVEVVCTTDDPSDSLQSHKQLANSGFTTKVLPTFRPDKVYNFSSTDGYISYLNTLSLASGIEITSYDSLLLSLQNRIKHFHETGCRLADHGLEQINIPAQVYNPQTLFTKLLGHEVLSGSEQISFRYSILIELCKMYHKQGWVQ